MINKCSDPKSEIHWKWRLEMAENIARNTDLDRFGLAGIYIMGSTKNATAGPCSDIDLLIYSKGTKKQIDELKIWIEGWSLCLAEINYNFTEYKIQNGLIDLHIITDEDIKNKTSYAIKINAVTDAARALKIK